jgi:hypothetical protein
LHSSSGVAKPLVGGKAIGGDRGSTAGGEEAATRDLVFGKKLFVSRMAMPIAVA